MEKYKYIFGPIPSRRLGLSLGVSTIPQKYCNYSCVYCQLGRTSHLTNDRKEFYSVLDILDEFKNYIKKSPKFDVVTLVGEGEPTLYSNLKELTLGIKKITSKPIALITNGSLLNNIDVQKDLEDIDILLPSLDAYDIDSFRKIHRPYGKIHYEDTIQGLIDFSHIFKGQIWLEIMLLDELNDDAKSIIKIKDIISKIKYTKIYINTVVRPPAEPWVKKASKDAINMAVNILGGVSIDALKEGGFYSEIKDNYEAILSIIKRHPMNQHELKVFLKSRNCENNDISNIYNKLKDDKNVEALEFKGYFTYRAIM
ncbi:radical SAM protein [Haloimpatiens sp. FM7315]|uniref:radical SAM protein n=1 Tax=Haloimpatiens sp. FM7315 TaxID=3298609 RepID=UPI00370C855C